MTSKSFNHQVRPIEPAEVERLNALDPFYLERPDLLRGRPCPPRQKCMVKGCGARVEFYALYEYVTGRKGRITWAQRHSCAEHARRFAEKNGIQFPGAVA